MEFFYIYKSLAHPQKDGYVQPVSIEERLMHVKEAKRRLDTEMPWLADSMDNDLKHAFGDRNNSEFVIGPDGRIAIARTWSDPEQLRSDLERLVGKVEKRTEIRELDRKTAPAPKLAARGVVPPIERPGGLSPVKSRPRLSAKEDQEPFYAKLRARGTARADERR